MACVLRAERQDLPALLQLYRDLHPDDDPLQPDAAEAVFDRLLLYPGSGIFLLREGERALASCTLIVIPNLTRNGRPYALIENVVTAMDHRKKGYGQRVLCAAIEAAWGVGCYKVMLLTGSKEPGTLDFYAKTGFEQSKTGFQIRRPSTG